MMIPKLESHASTKDGRAIMSRSSRLGATAIVILAIWLAVVPPVGAQLVLRGDLNGDGLINVVDVQLAVNAALGMQTYQTKNADLNGDGFWNVLDVQLVVNLALNPNPVQIGSLPTAPVMPLTLLRIPTAGLVSGLPVVVSFSSASRFSA